METPSEAGSQSLYPAWGRELYYQNKESAEAVQLLLDNVNGDTRNNDLPVLCHIKYNLRLIQEQLYMVGDGNPKTLLPSVVDSDTGRCYNGLAKLIGNKLKHNVELAHKLVEEAVAAAANGSNSVVQTTASGVLYRAQVLERKLAEASEAANRLVEETSCQQ